jgi:molybdopterin molybdotransferase
VDEEVMLAVADALHLVLQHSYPAAPAIISPLTDALGLVLAEDVASDLDMPPFDKALMDGYAVRRDDLTGDATELPVAGEVMAGHLAGPLPQGQAIRIMTGAPIPEGADAVVRMEHAKPLEGGRVRLESGKPKFGHFILRRGAEMTTGQVVLKTGTELRPQHIGLLASVGRRSVKAVPAPSIAILATGDELVEPSEKPGPGQLRNSNGPMLEAQALRAGAVPTYLGIARDEPAALQAMIEEGMKSPILALAGGVSMGDRDLVPEVLKKIGVESHVYKVAMKPGKPFYFGTRANTLVFGLPGNPVSSFCCFELFVRPTMRKVAGRADPGPNWRYLPLAEDVVHSSERPTYHPAVRETWDRGEYVRPVPWFGSPDLRGLAKADSLLLLPAGSHTLAAGMPMPVLALD